MTQSRYQSAVEVLTNTFVGMAGSYVITLTSFSVISDKPAIASAVAVTGCTVWSLLRGYYIRRSFARRES